jgi:hypothetical protein
MSTADLQESPIERVRSFLLSILNPQHLAQLDQILSGIDFNSGGPPAPVALQEGGTEPGGKPAQDRRRFGRDALPGRGPTDRDQNRPTGFDGRANYGGRLDGFAGDTALEDRTLRAQLRRMGVPVGDAGGLGVLRKVARSYGIPTGGMALDAAPHYASGDADAALDAVARIGTMSYAGRVRSDPLRVRADLAYDQASNPLSIGHMFPDLAARWAANERPMFAVPVNRESVRADERNAARRGRGGGTPMAYDSARPARSRGDAASVERMFPGLNLSRIGHVR